MSESKQPDLDAANSAPVSPVNLQSATAPPVSTAHSDRPVEFANSKTETQGPQISERRMMYEQQISYRSGMLPEPSELAAYNQIIENGAERLFKMVELQNAHRISLESKVVTSQQAQETRGQWFGLIIAIFFAGCGLYAVLNGHDWFGGLITGGTLVSLVGIFVYSKKQSQRDLADKRQDMNASPAPVPPSQLPTVKKKKRKNNR